MDDECVEELGRPISSLKVSELRDELAKRALIKTGKKNELIDRLRQAISKESNSTQQTAGSTATDLTVKIDTQDQVEAAIDYTTPQNNLSSTMSSNQQQVPMTAVDVVDYSSSKSDVEQQVRQQEDLVNFEAESKRQVELNDAHKQQEEQSRLDESRQEQLRVEPEADDHNRQSEVECQSLVEPEKQELVEQKSEEDLKTHDDSKTVEHELRETTPEGAREVIETSQKMGTFDGDKRSPDDEKPRSEIESIAPVTFTLKRGNRESSSTKAEKRRKWSGKIEQSQSTDSSIVSGGISSQKLQELIDLKPPNKSKQNEESQRITTDPDGEKSTEPEKGTISDSLPTKTADNLENIRDSKSEIKKDKSKLDAKSEHKEVAGDVNASGAKKEKGNPSEWIMIKNLTRPFTVEQLKTELTNFGPIVVDKFWIDGVKSKCCVAYETIEAAQQMKQSMQGQHWPLSNPKSLVVEFITEEVYNEAIKTPDPKKTSDKRRNNNVNGSLDKSNKQDNDPLSDRLNIADVGGCSIRERLGEKLGGDSVDIESGNHDIIGLDDLQPKELDDIFRKTKAKPQLFWLPLTEEQAEARVGDRQERDRRAKEAATSSSRRSPPPNRRRSPARVTRRSSPRHRSPAKRSPPRRRSPVRHRSPPSHSRRSPPRRRPPPSPLDLTPPPVSRRRSPLRDHSPLSRRRASPRDSPALRRRSPDRDSPYRRRTPSRGPPPFRRRTPPRDSPPMRRRSPSPLLIRRRTPPRDSPLMRRRSPGPDRRSPLGYSRHSPDMSRRSPGPIRHMSPGRRSPGIIRRSPGMTRRSPGLIRRSPGLIRRSPGPVRRSPGPVRR